MSNESKLGRIQPAKPKEADEDPYPPKHPLAPGEALSARAYVELRKFDKKRPPYSITGDSWGRD